MSRSDAAPEAARSLRVVLSTAPSDAAARRIARTVVEERLAACVNLVPGVTSIYRWSGAVQEDSEVLLVMKTCAERVDELVGRVRVLHEYALPEVIALPVDAGSEDYVRWVREETTR